MNDENNLRKKNSNSRELPDDLRKIYGMDEDDWRIYPWRTHRTLDSTLERALEDRTFFTRVPFDFNEFGGEFEIMKQELEKIIENIVQNGIVGISKSKNPFVSGVSIKMGPNGKPQIQKFGDIMAPSELQDAKDSMEVVPKYGELGDLTDMAESELYTREPLTDIIEDEDSISLTLELPGVEKEDIDLNLEGRTLKVEATSYGRSYLKRIPLPCEVKPDMIKSTYKNGILDITLDKVQDTPNCKKIVY